MASPKEAVKSASSFFEGILSVEDVRLEEIDLTGDEREWHITLSGVVPTSSKEVASIFRPTERVYKKFLVRKDNNEVLSMKIRVIGPKER